MQEEINTVLSEKDQLDLEREVYAKLCAPFGMSCYSVDSSRGFDLSSLKAAYVFDRLNEVLGLTNWQFLGNFEKQDDGGSVFFGQLIIRIGNRSKTVDGVGFGKKGKNPADTLKSAQTDALSKCASYVGVAIDAFKGKVDPKAIKAAQGNPNFAPKKTVAKPAPKKAEPKKEVKADAPKKSFITEPTKTEDSEDW